MIVRILSESFRRSRRRKVVTVAALAVASAVWAVVLGVAAGIGDQERKDLTAYGANIVVRPELADASPSVDGASLPAPPSPRTLPAGTLAALDSVFWKNNLTAASPVLETTLDSPAGPVRIEGVEFGGATAAGRSIGVRAAHPAWQLASGAWPSPAGSLAAAGERLAASRGWRPGSSVSLSGPGGTAELSIAGVFRSGEREDNALLVPLALAQRLSGRIGRVSRIEVVALTTPETVLMRKIHFDPRKLSPSDYDRWYCTPYASSIARELTEAIPESRAVVLRRVTEAEERAAQVASALLLFGGIAALAAAFLAVFSTLYDSITERSAEIGLWKAMGAEPEKVAAVFLAEAAIAGALGGVLGALAGTAAAPAAARAVFGFTVAASWPLAAVAAGCAVAVSLLASLRPIQRALRLEPIAALREGSSAP